VNIEFDFAARRSSYEDIPNRLKSILAKEGLSNSHLIKIRDDIVRSIYPFPLPSAADSSALRGQNFPSKNIHSKGFVVDTFLSERQIRPILDISKKILHDHSVPKMRSDDSNKLLDCLSASVINDVLVAVNSHTGYKNFIWNATLLPKAPFTKIVSDQWHYDNHYSELCAKVLVYLNVQPEGGGATEIAPAGNSFEFSMRTEYIGLLSQRKSFKAYAKRCPMTYEKLIESVFKFSPISLGSGLFFYPSKCLHRGVSPAIGERHVLAFSVMPLLETKANLEDGIEMSRRALAVASAKNFNVDYIPLLRA